MIVTQIGIAICGAGAVWLSQDGRQSRRRWSCVLGLAGQPFWLAETISAHQWGIVAMVAIYTWAWARGIRSNWMTRGPQ